MTGRLLFAAFLLLGVLVARSHAEAPMSRDRFTALYAEAARRAMPSATVRITGPLSLRIDHPNGKYATPYLDNAYAAYVQEPDRRDEIIAAHVDSSLRNLADDDLRIDPARIIPVIRSRTFTPVGEAEKDPAASDVVLFEPLGPDLAIVYAEDRPEDLRFFTAKYFEKASIDRTRLRALAVENLRRIVGDIEVRDYGGTYALAADGANEVGLILLPELWTKQRMKVDGDFVVALPTRDLLVVTGSNDAGALRRVRALAEEAFAKGPYSISPRLYLFRDGQLTAF